MKTVVLWAALVALSVSAFAQVKVGDNPGTINPNSLLELESTNKGFLPPRVALNSSTSISPLTGTVPAGMLVYSSGGTLADGYYYWNGTSWRLVATSGWNAVSKTSSTTLTKIETLVFASNDITVTLPAITSSDNGLEITVKNAGSHTDLVSVAASGSSTIDEAASAKLTKNCATAFVAYGGNWKVRQKVRTPENLLDVSANSSWTTIEEAIEFLEEHMSGPSVIRLDEEGYELSSTILIDLPYSLTIQGLSFGSTTISAASGLNGTPMFRCLSDTYFKMLQFDATSLSGYGTQVGEDAIRFVGSGTYNEVKDCSFDRFYNTILDSTDAEVWVFETDIMNARRNGILIHGNVPGVTLKVAETDFINCKYGVNLSKGTNATIQLASGVYYNGTATDTAVFYQPSSFTSITSISITGNSWNNVGKYIEGFDFARSDGRDAGVFIENNAGIADARPHCHISLLSGNTTTTLSNTNAWYKLNWINTAFTTVKWGIANNRITYQPTNKRDVFFTLSGNLSVVGNNKTISIGIVKNGSSAVRYGETTLRTSSSGTASQFSTVVFITDVGPTDYFEVYVSTTTGGDVVTVLDLNWVTNTQ